MSFNKKIIVLELKTLIACVLSCKQNTLPSIRFTAPLSDEFDYAEVNIKYFQPPANSSPGNVETKNILGLVKLNTLLYLSMRDKLL